MPDIAILIRGHVTVTVTNGHVGTVQKSSEIVWALSENIANDGAKSNVYILKCIC